MTYDANWPRWIIASLARHFQDCNANFFVEGFERDTDNVPEFVELRVDGPYIQQQLKDQWRLDVELNILICVNNSNNAYRPQEIQGQVVKKFLDCVEVLRIGNQEPDDQTLVGCLRLQQRGPEKIVITNFGQIKNEVKQNQSSIEGHYRMYL